MTAVLILGASARAASWSAVRAGWSPVAIDQFGDLDFPAECPTAKLSELTLAALEQALREKTMTSKLPLFLTGGWENQLERLAELAEKFSLWNVSLPAMEQARNPYRVQQILRQAGRPALAIRTATTEGAVVDRDKNKIAKVTQWLRKPLRGTAGIGISVVESAIKNAVPSLPGPLQYDQQFVAGTPCSALYLSRLDMNQTRHTDLLGWTFQLIGCPELPDRPFAYAGNIAASRNRDGGVYEDFSQHQVSELELQKTGTLLAESLQLTGLWGLDFIQTSHELFVTEINPRYTAAVEVLELQQQRSALAALPSDPEQKQLPRSSADIPLARGVNTDAVGKQILYASREFRLKDDWNWEEAVAALVPDRTGWQYSAWQIPVLSDLPRQGVHFRPGDPVCTIWGHGKTVDECHNQLQTHRHMLLNLLKST